MQSEEQRSHIRVRDRVYLKIDLIDNKKHDTLIKGLNEGSEPFLGEDSRIIASHNIHDTINKIRDKDAALATVLESLDNKLSMILNLLQNSEESTQYQLYNVDISAAGLNIATQKPLNTGQCLELIIGLLPRHYFFRAFGKVVRVEQKKENHYNIGISFTWMTEDDKEALIEHIFNIQVVQLRMRRKKMEREEEETNH